MSLSPYYESLRAIPCRITLPDDSRPKPLDSNLHSLDRRLIELTMEHADLDAMVDRAALVMPVDELMMRRLKKRRLALKDEMARIRQQLTPNEPA